MNQSILETRNLTKRYGTLTALNGISLSLERGKIIGLLGPNGSGKTTFIKCINGLLVPDSGELLIAGMNPGVETKKIVSYLPDKNYLAGWMSVRQLFDFYQDFYADFDRHKATDMLARLGLEEKMKFKTMSKGTKEKVQLILVMSRNAHLYCLDEPIAGVDPASRDYILQIIISNYNPEATILLSTHLIADIENVLDEVLFLQQGNIRLHATIDQIREEKRMSVDELFREVFRC